MGRLNKHGIPFASTLTEERYNALRAQRPWVGKTIFYPCGSQTPHVDYQNLLDRLREVKTPLLEDENRIIDRMYRHLQKVVLISNAKYQAHTPRWVIVLPQNSKENIQKLITDAQKWAGFERMPVQVALDSGGLKARFNQRAYLPDVYLGDEDELDAQTLSTANNTAPRSFYQLDFGYPRNGNIVLNQAGVDSLVRGVRDGLSIMRQVIDGINAVNQYQISKAARREQKLKDYKELEQLRAQRALYEKACPKSGRSCFQNS